RANELSKKWGCKFEVVWDTDVYDAALVENFLHAYLENMRSDYEFFAVKPEVVKEWAEAFFDVNWREIEGDEILPTDISELASLDASGYLVEPDDTPRKPAQDET
ncbi:MAG: GIY-YIG nuclease family protein, partial [Nitrospiraceae bacterium]